TGWSSFESERSVGSSQDSISAGGEGGSFRSGFLTSNQRSGSDGGLSLFLAIEYTSGAFGRSLPQRTDSYESKLRITFERASTNFRRKVKSRTLRSRMREKSSDIDQSTAPQELSAQESYRQRNAGL